MNGFSEKVYIGISDSEQIGSIISIADDRFDNIEESNNYIISEMTERGYSESFINKYLEHM